VDVRDAQAVDELARTVRERFGRIDLWVNNAGVLEPIRPLRDVESQEMEEHLAINVLGGDRNAAASALTLVVLMLLINGVVVGLLRSRWKRGEA